MTTGRTLILAAVPLLLALALAADEPPPLPSLLVLSNATDKATLTLGGEDELTVKGGLHVNSPGAAAVYNFSSKLTVADGVFGLVGGYQELGKAEVNPKPTAAQPLADPYTHTDWPQTGDEVSRQLLFVGQGKEAVLKPGIYYGGVNASLAGKVTLEPGCYLFVNGDFTFGKGELVGDKVCLMVGGQRPGLILFASEAKVHLTPPTEGPMAGFVIATWNVHQNNVTAVASNGAQVQLDGLVYAPLGLVGCYFKGEMTLKQVVCWALMLNTAGKVSVTGPSLKPAEAVAEPAAPGG